MNNSNPIDSDLPAVRLEMSGDWQAGLRTISYKYCTTLLTKRQFCAIILNVKYKNKNKHKHMRDKNFEFSNSLDTTKINTNEFASVYYYLFTGITLLIAVFLFLPRVSGGL